MSTVSRSAVICALLLLSLSLCAAIGASAVSATEPENSLSVAGSAGVANESIPHQNPEEYNDEPDSDSTESWLEAQLGDRLEDSSIALSDGQYDLAQELLGEEYEDQFEQYVEVSGGAEETGTGEANTTAELLKETGEEQQRQATLLEDYNETLDEYEEAVELGNADQARDLARELNELAEEIDASSENLDRFYENLTVVTERDFSETRASANETNTNTQGTQSAIRQTEFVQTNLHLKSDAQTTSFTDPLTISGEIETADDSELETEEIQFTVENTTITAEPGEGGTVEFDYQPTMVPVSADSISIAYIPDSQSTYLGSETELNVSLEQIQPALTVEDTFEELAYGDEGTVEGEFVADGYVVDDVPLEITLDGEVRGETTVVNGSFSSSITVPAGVEDGEQSIGAVFPYEGRALAPTEANTTVIITETDTELAADPTIEEAENGSNQLVVSGTLETPEGDGISNESIAIEIDGTASETVTTDNNGAFSEILAVSSDSGEELTVSATYEGTGSNFAPASTEQTVVLSSGGSLLESGIVLWGAIAGGAGLLAVFGAGLWFRQRRSDTDQPDPDIQTGAADSNPSPEAELPVDALLSEAGHLLSSGQSDIAVRNAYTAVRNTYAMADEHTEQSRSLTHWEFYDRYQSHVADEPHTGKQFRTLTEAYERAAFTPQSVPQSEAATVVNTASLLCGLDDPSQSTILASETAE